MGKVVLRLPMDSVKGSRVEVSWLKIHTGTHGQNPFLASDGVERAKSTQTL